MPRSEAPLGKAVIWPKLIEYAEENGIAIDRGLSHKVDWMEEHKGACFCDWSSGRVCPCGNIDTDFKKYNGQCLCGLLLTHKRLAQKNDYYMKKEEKKRLIEEEAKLEEEKLTEEKDMLEDSKE